VDDLEGERHDLFEGDIPAFTWRKWGNPWRTQII